MPLRLEDYGLIGDTHTAALVGHDGSIDWLCVPRFDSGACFAALLGEPEHGRWLLAPAGDHRATRRRYRDDTLVLETEYTTHEGAVRVVDCMPVVGNRPDVLRRVEGLSGRVRVRSELVLRLDYGHIVPWIREVGRRASAFAGPDALTLDSDVDHRREGDDLVGVLRVGGRARGVAADLVHPARPATRTRRRRKRHPFDRAVVAGMGGQLRLPG